MDAFFIKASSLLGGKVVPDHLKLAFSILFTYPCALLFKYHLKSNQIKHVFSIIYTSFIMLFVLKLYDGFIHTVAIAALSYYLMKYCHHAKVAWINFTFVMFSMSVCHIGRLMKGVEGDTELDYSGAMMIITIKLSSYGFNVLDGQLTNQKSSHAQQMKIEHYPTLLQYFGWVFFFAGFLAGPTCEYMDYVRFVESPPSTHINTWTPALKRCGKSFIFIACLVYLAPTYNYFEALKPEWQNKGFWGKMFFIQLSAFLTRCKYYGIWYLSEGACILSGFGFNGYDKDKRPTFNRLTNVNVLACEGAQSYKQLSENWNIGANHWLRHYVYLRFNPPGSAASTLKTYVVSSMWHGFHPGFYVFFLTASVLQIIARQVRRTVRPLFLTMDGQPIKYWKSCYDVSTWLVSMGLLNMLVPCFDLLYIPKVMHIWRQVYYCHFVFVAAGCVLFFALKPYLRSIQKRRVKVGQVDSLQVKKQL